MIGDILGVLKSGGIIVGDGAMGTTLHARGLPAGTMPELWNTQNPQTIAEVHLSYIQAGAQFITTNTFNCNIPRMREAGLLGQRLELLRAGIMIARQASAGRVWVGASIGPTGQLLEPLGPLALSDLEYDYREQVETAADAGADFIKIETQQDIEEASAAVRMAKRFTSLPVWCTCAFNGRSRTLMGVHAADAAVRLQDEGADIVGANCGEGPAAIEAALKAMRPATGLPLAAQSNAGIPRLGEGGRTIWDIEPEQMGVYAARFLSLGAQIVAGCCGTSPAHVAAIYRAIHKEQGKA